MGLVLQHAPDRRLASWHSRQRPSSTSAEVDAAELEPAVLVDRAGCLFGARDRRRASDRSPEPAIAAERTSYQHRRAIAGAGVSTAGSGAAEAPRVRQDGERRRSGPTAGRPPARKKAAARRNERPTNDRRWRTARLAAKTAQRRGERRPSRRRTAAKQAAVGTRTTVDRASAGVARLHARTWRSVTPALEGSHATAGQSATSAATKPSTAARPAADAASAMPGRRRHAGRPRRRRAGAKKPGRRRRRTSAPRSTTDVARGRRRPTSAQQAGGGDEGA